MARNKVYFFEYERIRDQTYGVSFILIVGIQMSIIFGVPTHLHLSRLGCGKKLIWLRRHINLLRGLGLRENAKRWGQNSESNILDFKKILKIMTYESVNYTHLYVIVIFVFLYFLSASLKNKRNAQQWGRICIPIWEL